MAMDDYEKQDLTDLEASEDDAAKEDAGEDTGGDEQVEPEKCDADGPESDGEGSRIKRALPILAALAAILVLAAAAGTSLWGPRAEKPPSESDRTEQADAVSDVAVTVEAEGWDDASSPFLVHVEGEGSDFWHATWHDADKNTPLELEPGEYELTWVSAINRDGSIYELGSPTDLEVADEGGEAKAPEATLVPAEEVKPEQIEEIIEGLEEAVGNGDDSLTGDAGSEVSDVVSENAGNAGTEEGETEDGEPSTDEDRESGQTDQPAAQEPDSGSKPSGGSSGSKPSGGSASDSGSGSSSSKPAGGTSGGSSSTPAKPAHQHSWQPVYRSEPVYETQQVWVPKIETVTVSSYTCNQCGYSTSSYSDIEAHFYNSYLSGGNCGTYTGGEYTNQVDNGHYESQTVQTGTTQVLDHYACACGAVQ